MDNPEEIQRLTIVRFARPTGSDLNEVLQWFAASLGMFSLRDKDRSHYRIFIELLKGAKKEQPMSSEEIAERLHLSRATVVHHLNKLREAGLINADRKRYMLRVKNLSYLVDELEQDSRRCFESLREVGKDLDRRLGL